MALSLWGLLSVLADSFVETQQRQTELDTDHFEWQRTWVGLLVSCPPQLVDHVDTKGDPQDPPCVMRSDRRQQETLFGRQRNTRSPAKLLNFAK